MSNSDVIKAALTSEIEENLSQSTNAIFKTKIIESIIASLTDRDFVNNREAILKAFKYGIDASFRDWRELTVHNDLKNGEMNPERTQDMSSRQDLFTQLLGNIDTSDYEISVREEDDEAIDVSSSSLDRIRSLNLPRGHFERFFQHLKSVRPQLFHHISQNSVFHASTSRIKKKKTRKDKKRERREKRASEHLESKILSEERDLDEYEKAFLAPSRSIDSFQSDMVERRRDVTITLFVCKCVVEGTVNSFLAAVLYLLHVWNNEEGSETLSLPLGGLMNSLLGLPSRDTKSAEKEGKDENVPKFVLTSKSLAFRTESVSEASGDHSRENSTFEDAISLADSYFHSAYSETGSTIGSVTVEVGAEAASLEYEMSEDEMLAQALAMSLAVDSTTPVAKDTSSIEESRNVSQSTKVVKEKTSESQYKVKINSEEKPSKKISTDPTSSYAPLDYAESIYRDLEFTHSNNISILSTIIGLLMVISANSDRILNEDVNPELVSSADNYYVISHPNNSTINRSACEINFHPTYASLLILEYVIDFLIDKLTRETKLVLPVTQTKKGFSSFNLLCWSLVSSIKVLRGHIYLCEILGKPFSSFQSVSVGDALAFRISVDNPQSNTVTLTDRLTKHLINTMHIDALKIQDQLSPISKAFQIFGSIEMFHSDPQNQFFEFLRHSIRIQSIQTFVSGFCAFCPNLKDRECLLRNLMATPIVTNSDKLSTISYPKQREFPKEYYNHYTLNLLFLMESKHPIGLSFISRLEKVELNYEDVDGTSPRSITTYESKIRLEHCPYSIEDISKFSDLSWDIALIRRLRNSFSTEMNVESMIDKQFGEIIDPKNNRQISLHYGEFNLLLNILQRYSQRLVDIHDNRVDSSVSTLRFNTKTSSPLLSYSDDDKTVSHKGPKTWVSAVTHKGFAPNTGVYEISFKVDKCDRGQVFLGLTTLDNYSLNENHFVGCDRFSWGLIGTDNLWHNGVKIRQDYGSIINNRSTVKLKYDSNYGTVSYQIGDARWGVAFASLPKETLFPVVSLHDKDDKISIIGWTIVQDELRVPDNLKTKANDEVKPMKEKEDVSRFVKLAQALICEADDTLSDIHEGSNVQKQVLSHPFLGVFIPSICASVLLLSKSQCQGYVTMQLLPYLTVFTKRLQAVYDTFNETGSSQQPFFALYPMIPGEWKFRSGYGSSSLPAQEYILKFDDTLQIFDYQKVKTGDDSRSGFQSWRLSGGWKNSGKNVSVLGTQSGTSVKFVESWESGGNCLVEGKISLCGTYFAGKYSDPKSGKSGTLDGMLISPSFTRYWKHIDVLTKSNVAKALSLCTLAGGKLIGSLIIGIKFSDDGGRPSGTEPTDVSVDGEESQNQVTTKADLDTWIQSDLFSNGFPLDTESAIQFSIGLELYYSKSELSSPTSNSELRSKQSWLGLLDISEPGNGYFGVMNWWLSTIFPEFCGDTDNSTMSTSDKKEEPPNLISQILSGSSFGGKLDEYVSQHSGPSALLKVGGEPMIVARRLIIACLIRHSGTLSLCQAEVECLRKGTKSADDNRPHPILIEVWKAAQRIVENLIRQRQKTGSTYAAISLSVCSKADLLLKLNVSDASSAVGDSIAMMASELVLREATQTESDSDILKDCTKLITDVVEFLTSSIRNVDDIKTRIFQNTARAMSRTAGFRCALAFLGKIDNVLINRKPTNLSSLSSISLQSMLMDYILLSLHGYTDVLSTQSLKPFNYLLTRSEEVPSGHYMSDLYGLNNQVRKNLRESFESVYEFNTQLLSRCTWLGDKEGQYSSLSAWGISISPMDHVFLNRVGIFRVLQTVLDDVRASSVELAKRPNPILTENFRGSIDIDELTKIDPARGPFGHSMVLSSMKRLSQLSLKIVHNLASQVAFAKDPSWSLSQTATPKLMRMPSGPDTLSVSLFEMLYSELFCGLKRIISQTLHAVTTGKVNESSSETKSSTTNETAEDDSLDGEQHIDRILKLLFFVSTSKSCHKSLSSSKWLSLLISSLGCGSLPIQRRVSRLLRRIVSNTHPNTFLACVSGFFSPRDEILSSESPLDEDDFDTCNGDNDFSGVSLIFGSDDVENVTSSDKFIVLLLEALSVISPSFVSHESSTAIENRQHSFLNYYRSQKLAGFVAAEALVFLRVLLGMPVWRSQIFRIVSKIIQLGFHSKKDSSDIVLNDCIWNNSYYVKILAASFGLCGGYIDRLRPGGTVTLKPFILAAMSDTFANKLASTIHNTGILVSQSSSGDSVEIILMERGMRYVKNENTDASDEKTIHFTTTVNGPLPVRTVRLNAGDIFPTYDVPFLSDTVSKSYFTDNLMAVVKSEVVPWIFRFIENNKSVTSNIANPGPVIIRTSNERVERSRRIITSESGDRESGDSENEDNYRENDDNEEDVDVGSEMEDEEHEKEDDYEHVSPQQLFEQYEPSMPDQSPKEQIDAQTMSAQSEDSNSPEILKLHVRVASMKSLSIAVLNDGVASEFLQSQSSLFEELLKLSVVETQCGGLHVIESAEEKWGNFWDAYCALSSDVKTKVVSTLSASSSSNPPAATVSSEDAEILRQLRSDSSERSSLNESAPFAPFLLGRSIDPAAKAEAISQMMDMGLPREWCETSLRRCRYNVEMAINMCFEHGEEMSRFVAEDNAMLAVQSREREGNSWRRRPLSSSEDAPVSMPGGITSSMSNLTRALARGRLLRPDGDTLSSVRQLLDMGFPPSWCSRAMEQSNNDVAGALAWILSHNEDLAVGAPGERPSEQSTAKSVEDVETQFIPLESVCGSANVTPDLVCSLGEDGFPSVGCRGYPASKGKWYYEITLLSTGCIQIGWVDSSYVGSASGGQGVGDCSHSWAYDGWRVHLWHEISSPWGAKWNLGDIVGCAVDLDNRIMRFSLNGFNEEIDMGVAFTNFHFQGGLYPCVSFNKKEKVQFNFGGSPFKYSPPEDHIGFIHHINNVRIQNISLCDQISNEIYRNSLLGRLNNSSKATQGNMFDDAFEENITDKQSNSSIRRYFHDESGRSDRNNSKMPAANISAVVANDGKMITEQLSSLSKDLCILHARQTVLRLLHSLSRLSEGAIRKFVSLFTTENRKFADGIIKFVFPGVSNPSAVQTENVSSLETLCLLMRICGVHTSRTRIYLHTLSLSPASVTPHHFLGSFTSVGGAPFFDGLRNAMSTLVRYSRSHDSKSIIDVLLDNLRFDCISVTKRDQNNEFRRDGGLSPYQTLGDGVASHAIVLSTSSLTMATWITALLMEQFAYELSNCSKAAANEVVVSDISHWLDCLADCWSIALKSPSALVKTCACECLSSLFQELCCSSVRFQNIPKSLILKMTAKIDLIRLKKVVVERLNVERSNHPICSEYLQSLVELYVTLNHCNYELTDSEHEADDYSIVLPQLETKHDLESPNFNWEASSGRIVSDTESTVVWTGFVTQNECQDIPAYDRRISERIEYPPELLVGCKVIRKVLVPKPPQPENESTVERSESTSSAPAAPGPESDLNEWGDELTRANDDESFTFGGRGIIPSPSFLEKIRLSAAAMRAKSSAPDETTKDSGMIEQTEVGTVIEVCNWENDYPGTARVVQWENGKIDTYRWGASGKYYDLTHAKLVNGKWVEYPKPIARSAKAANQSFGIKVSFGIILRLRKMPRLESDGMNVQNRLIGTMEWPDFNSIVCVEGCEYLGNNWILTDKSLLAGPENANWSIRFGENTWKPGTSYNFSLSPSVQDPTDSTSLIMQGNFRYSVKIPFVDTVVHGDIQIQRARLFFFDEKFHSSNISPSWDRLSITKNTSGSSQGSAFGTIGFSTGVHYWELKVEQAEVGSVFIGVSEKPGLPGLVTPSKCVRWMGCGFVSHRASYRAATSHSTERVAVYGDYFHTGDIIGVLLDMNRGRLSFFLDGMKYGEHTIADLGEAFDNLTSPTSVKMKVFYPVVGLSRFQDRVTITPRWISTIGSHPEEELRLVSRAWRMMTSWSIERPTSRPSEINLWAYRDAWRDWRRWLSGKYMRIRTRLKTSLLMIDISPQACVQASIKLGLPVALFHGDRICFEKSSGRKLETKEEAVILGVYQGQLWFRHDSQQSSTSLSESMSVAWALSQNDTDGMTIIRRSMIKYPFAIPSSVVSIELPRIKSFRGGLVTLTLSSGAAMRNGLEIDTSDMIREISADTVLYAIETRLNSSNINRLKVLYSGAVGWISERMRGGAEEVIIRYHTNISKEELQSARDDIIRQANEIGVTERIIWEDVDTLDEAMELWMNKVEEIGYGHLLKQGNVLSANPIVYDLPRESEESDPLSFDSYLFYATTMDGKKNWTVEADMQLAECLTKTAGKEGVSPQNLTCQALRDAIHCIDNESSLLFKINTNRAIARAALLRVANQVIGYALPYFDLMQIDERLRRDISGSDDEIEISCTYIPSSNDIQASVSSTADPSNDTTNSSNKQWQPPSWARRLRSMRRVLFGQTKRLFWESVLESTTTFTPLHQDEYEDPREIKTISINRIKANPSKLATYSNVHERLKQSVFGQLQKELRNWSDSNFRRSYVGKGHGGQKRSFKVKFVGEGVNDYGGPYRAVYEQIVDELQCDRAVKSSEKSLLPLLLPSNNRSASVGSIQDKFVLSTSSTTSPAILELMHFFGKLLGSAVRQNLNLALDLSLMVWRPLVRLPLSRAHLETVDSLMVKSLDDITKKGLQLEQEPIGTYSMNYVPPEWEDLNFMIYLPDGSRAALLPGGEDIPVNLSNWRQYVTLAERSRLRESVVMLKALRDGLATVLPIELLPLFTPHEFEQIICGNSNVDISLLRQCTEYEDIDPNGNLATMFWEVLEEFSLEEKTSFLRFVWARSRMPTSAEDLLMNFKLQLAHGDARSKPDLYLPHAQTCFFSLSLPPYTTKDIMKEKLLYAIHNSPNMDADVRLHHADGWADA